jgi:anti-sigma28 factor (negative regulator of flagellin synthesis)
MDARAAREPNPMDESRTMKMQSIRERLERDEYEVDPREVADAIVARLLSARSHATSQPQRPTT